MRSRLTPRQPAPRASKDMAACFRAARAHLQTIALLDLALELLKDDEPATVSPAAKVKL